MVYTVKQGDTLSGIAKAHSVSVNDLAKWNNLITTGMVLKVVDPTPPSPPEDPVMTTIKWSDTGPYGTQAANRIIQDALNKEYGGVVVDGWYGPQTTAAYTRWQQSLGYSGSDADGIPGVVSLPKLGEKYKFKVVLDSAPKGPPTGSEPSHNYTRVSYGGRTVNVRTREMLEQAKAIYGKSFPITQGSYNRGGVAASAGTHDGGGVVDIGDTSTSLLKALRQVGFAAWVRTPSEGFSYHIHAVAIGDRELSSSAKNQITQYYNGRNGLANAGPDTAPSSVGRPYPAWTAKYGAPVR